MTSKDEDIKEFTMDDAAEALTEVTGEEHKLSNIQDKADAHALAKKLAEQWQSLVMDGEFIDDGLQQIDKLLSNAPKTVSDHQMAISLVLIDLIERLEQAKVSKKGLAKSDKTIVVLSSLIALGVYRFANEYRNEIEAEFNEKKGTK